MVDEYIPIKRYPVFISACFINICLGAVMAWSVFATQFKIENPEWSMAQISGVFSITIFFFAVTTLFSGMAQDKLGPRIVASTGGLLLGIGVIMAGYANSLSMLYLGYGIIGGIGIGTAFVAPLAAVVKWYPDKKGLAAGIVMGSFGAGALIFAPVGEILTKLTGNVNRALLIHGFIYLIVIIIAAQFLKEPPGNFTVKHGRGSSKEESSANNYTLVEMLKTVDFYMIFLIFMFAWISGLIFMGNAREVSQLFADLTDAAAVSVVSIVSIANMLGAPSFGVLTDRMGYKKALIILLLGCAAALLLLPYSSSYGFLLCNGSLLMFCYGGLFGILPIIVTNFYGNRHFGTNYGLVYLGYGFAAILGPGMAAALSDLFQRGIKTANDIAVQTAIITGYSTAFFISAGLCLVAALITFLIRTEK